jgi:Tfp pilus assembly protein PilN
MLKTNLSTRPFYNERAVQFWLLVIAVIVAAATVFNVTRLVQYSRSDTELAGQASQDETRTADLKAQAAQLRASVDTRQIEAASAEARLANDLIDRRTFSWTELFNVFERTLPADVRVTSIRPRLEKDRRILLTITVLARSVDDIDMFMENLEATGGFDDLLSREDHPNEEKQWEAVIETYHAPGKAKKAR